MYYLIYFALQRLLATLCCLLLAVNVCHSQQEISIGDLLEEAKIDVDNELLKNVEKELPAKEAGAAGQPAKDAEGESTPRPRLFRPKQNRPSFKNILQQRAQDQQKSGSLFFAKSLV